VLIGGVPLPSSLAIAGALLKFLKGLKFPRLKGKKPEHHDPCATEAQPIDLVSGAFIDTVIDWLLPGESPFVWQRFYDSRWANVDGPLGRGHRHAFQWELRRNLDGLLLVTPRNEAIPFPPLEPGQSAARDGFRLSWPDAKGPYRVQQNTGDVFTFRLPPG